MLVVPMLSIHYFAQWLFPTDATHPFIEMVLQNPQPVYLVPIVVAAVIVAPVVEEFMFRVFLQGWLERLCLRGPQTTGDPPGRAQGGPTTRSATGRGRRGRRAGLAAHAMARPTDCPVLTSRQTDGSAERRRPADSRGGCPILVSGLLFALAHAGQGPAPIPLFFLGLGLGYLYQRTHRVLPCIVVHFLVNTTAVVQLALYVAQQAGPN